MVERIIALEKKRTEASNDIADVLNKDVKTLTLTRLIELLSSQPKERDALASIHDRLSLTMKRMVDVMSAIRHCLTNPWICSGLR